VLRRLFRQRDGWRSSRPSHAAVFVSLRAFAVPSAC